VGVRASGGASFLWDSLPSSNATMNPAFSAAASHVGAGPAFARDTAHNPQGGSALQIEE